MMDQICLGDVFRYLRLSRGFKQEEVADFVFMNRSVYARKECGTSQFSICELLTLCDFYHVTPNDVLGYGSIDYALVSCSDLSKRVRGSRGPRFRFTP